MEIKEIAKAVGQGVKDAIAGKDCTNCQDIGVRCHDVGLIDNNPGGVGETVIFLDEDPIFRTAEKIAQCDVILGNETKETVVTQIRKNAKISKDRVNISDLGIGNY